MASDNEGIRKVQNLLEQVDQSLNRRGNLVGPVKLSPWLTVSNLPRFLETMRNEIRAVEEGKGPIGYPVTTAVWEDLVKKLEILAEVLSHSRNA